MASTSSDGRMVIDELHSSSNGAPQDVKEAQDSAVSQEQAFVYNAEKHKALVREKPWAKNPTYFQQVDLSTLALLKMAMHAKSGCPLEVMGVMVGWVQANTFVVVDSYPLPVEGTETRVSAMEEALEFMVSYKSSWEAVGRLEPVVGWYHSHPGYGCWLSGIDCETQKANQEGQDPFLAVVIDPVRTAAAGKVEIGAFRTYPASYRPPSDKSVSSLVTGVPMDKIADYGVQRDKYYQLKTRIFKSNQDEAIISQLWTEYWAGTLASSPLLSNASFASQRIDTLGRKLERVPMNLNSGTQMRAAGSSAGTGATQTNELSALAQESAEISVDQIRGLLTELIKQKVFETPPNKPNEES